VHKYKLTFLTFSFKRQSSVHLSLFYQITKETEIIFKSYSSIQVAQLIDLTGDGKEIETHKPAIE